MHKQCVSFIDVISEHIALTAIWAVYLEMYFGNRSQKLCSSNTFKYAQYFDN